MIEASDPAAIYQYTLDNLDRVTVETQNSSGIGLVPTVRMTRGYDLVSNRTSLAAEFFVGAAVTKDFSNAYVFDGLNRVGRITQTAQGSGAGFHAVQDKRVNLTYNALGQFTFISRYENVGAVGTNLRSVYSYDQANRLTGLAHRNISGVPVATDLSVYGFSYDPMNRIKTIDHTGPSGGISDGQSTFNYDQTSQLTLADHAPARPDENLSYDLNGNRTNAGYTTLTNNQTTASQDSTAQKYSYVYDKEGNRTRRTKLAANGTTVQGVEDYTFDHRNRLTNVTFRATVGGTVLKTVNYTYDIFNRLVKRSYDSNGPTAGGVTDTYFAGYDGINPTLELSKADPGAGGVSAADLKHRYLWGPVVDQLFADEQFGAGTGGASSPTVGVGNTLWALSDHLGTVRDIADFNPGTTTFTIVNHRVYDSFGKLTAESNTSVDLAFGYTGKYNDEVTQLSLHWNRWLDTNLGKWISEDPIGFGGGDASLVRYVRNTPTAKMDSTGFQEEDSHYNPSVPAGAEEWVWPWSPRANWGVGATGHLWWNKTTYYGGATARGGLTSGKALGNTVVGTVTLGYVSEAIAVNENDLGYEGSAAAFGLARDVIPITKAGKVVQLAQKALDKASDAATVVEGVSGIAEDGVDFGDLQQIGSAVAGNAKLPKPAKNSTTLGMAEDSVPIGGATKTIKERTAKGADGATSQHIVERDVAGNVTSKTHHVTKDGKVIHQHQDHVGKYGGERRFPDDWVEFPEVDALPLVPRKSGRFNHEVQ